MDERDGGIVREERKESTILKCGLHLKPQPNQMLSHGCWIGRGSLNVFLQKRLQSSNM